jgi:hypothetical protein
VWTLWSLGCATTIARIVLRFNAQGKLHAEDFLAILAFLFLTGLTAVATREGPIFEMTQTYLLAVAEDPSTPLPLPLDQYIDRTTTALKLMFGYGVLVSLTILFANRYQANALVLVYSLGRLVFTGRFPSANEARFGPIVPANNR